MTNLSIFNGHESKAIRRMEFFRAIEIQLLVMKTLIPGFQIVLIFITNSSLINDFIKEPNGFITGLYNGQLSSTHQRHK